MKTRTEQMVDELQEAEEILGVLDQHAIAQGPALSRAYHRFYNELLKLRDEELRDWNDDASCGLRDARRMLYLCDNAERPYHAPTDGPCEVYTPNFDAGVHLCDTCLAAAIAEGIAKEEAPC